MADLLKTQVEGLGGGKSDASHTPLFFMERVMELQIIALSPLETEATKSVN